MAKTKPYWMNLGESNLSVKRCVSLFVQVVCLEHENMKQNPNGPKWDKPANSVPPIANESIFSALIWTISINLTETH